MDLTDFGCRSFRRYTARLHSGHLLELLELFLNCTRSAVGTHQGRDSIEVNLDFMNCKN